MQRHSSVKRYEPKEMSPDMSSRPQLSQYHEYLSSIKKLKAQRKEMESRNITLKNKVELLEKEDKKIVDKIFYIKNLQVKVTQAREVLKTSKAQKNKRLLSEQRHVQELKKRNFEFKQDIENSKIKAIEAIKLHKEQLYQEGKRLREKALKMKIKSERKLKVEAQKTKKENDIGKQWLKYQQEQRSQLLADRLLVEQKDENNRLKKAKRELKKYQNKEQIAFSTFHKDQVYQETVLEEFKNTINKGHID